MAADPKIVEFAVENTEKLKRIATQVGIMNKELIKLKKNPDFATLQSIWQNFDNAFGQFRDTTITPVAYIKTQISQDSIAKENRTKVQKILDELKQAFPADKYQQLSFNLSTRNIYNFPAFDIEVKGPIIKKGTGLIFKSKDTTVIVTLVHLAVSVFGFKSTISPRDDVSKQIIEVMNGLLKKYEIPEWDGADRPKFFST